MSAGLAVFTSIVPTLLTPIASNDRAHLQRAKNRFPHARHGVVSLRRVVIDDVD